MSSAPHILVIDDEPQILRAMRTILTEKQFRVTTANHGEEGLALAATTEPDLVVLDLGLPDIDGVEVCKRLREWTQIPIIILSVRDSERDKVAALDMGADDYLTKPFGIEELLARVRVALRHSASRKGEQNKVVKAGPLMIDRLAYCEAWREKVKLTGREYRLLASCVQSRARAHPSKHSHARLGARRCRSHGVSARLYAPVAQETRSQPRTPSIYSDRTGYWLSFYCG
jgi:two-component system KDP operon response regulator KdpE